MDLSNVSGWQAVLVALIATVPPTIIAYATLRQSKKNGVQTDTQTMVLKNETEKQTQRLTDKSEEIHNLLIDSQVKELKADLEFSKDRLLELYRLLEKSIPVKTHPKHVENHKILVIEDSKEDAFLLTSKCEALGYVVDIAKNMREAWNFLLSNGGYDVVFLDLNLPDSTIDHLLNVIRKLKPHSSKIIVWTGDNNPLHRTKSMSFGADDYLWKDDPDFNAKLRKIVRESNK